MAKPFHEPTVKLVFEALRESADFMSVAQLEPMTGRHRNQISGACSFLCKVKAATMVKDGNTRMYLATPDTDQRVRTMKTYPEGTRKLNRKSPSGGLEALASALPMGAGNLSAPEPSKAAGNAVPKPVGLHPVQVALIHLIKSEQFMELLSAVGNLTRDRV